MKHKPTRSVQVPRLAFGSVQDIIQGIGDSGNESGASVHTPLQVPLVRTFNFLPRLGMKSIGLTFCH